MAEIPQRLAASQLSLPIENTRHGWKKLKALDVPAACQPWTFSRPSNGCGVPTV
ncbi:hypothetical protein R69888_03534 [Paraburkholderia haematera]|uniref:Transposase n=1 Tax=Paraburkholderia haematera TaxID=2793077 RepID=A0ABM8RPA4_9BURK|nr:hypothetical protein R69888_03534 [Paraburkholderia haematera]